MSPILLKELLYPSWRLGLIIGSKKRISRSKAMKSVLAYIRTHKLQDPHNKQMFTPDNILAPIFSKEKIREFSMAKYLKGHLTIKKPLDRYIYKIMTSYRTLFMYCIVNK